MGSSSSSNRPQDIGSPDIDYDYYFNRPQKLFSDPTPPPPSVVDHELAEQVASVFDDVIYNETGGGNDGQIAVTVI